MVFSVLISVYAKETATNLDQCFESILINQTVKPAEVILVEDGPLGCELESVIKSWFLQFPDVIKTLQLEKNVGLGSALEFGLRHCSNDLVARMDSDDICCHDRFERQCQVFNGSSVDVCSSFIAEFVKSPSNITGIREVPEEDVDIKETCLRRNPINHPAVMFKKSKVLAAKSYEHMPYFEDYFLWIKLIKNGCEFYNIPSVLLLMRAGTAQTSRRRGVKYLLHEAYFFYRVFLLGFTPNFSEWFLIFFRLLSRIVPKWLLSTVYKNKLRKNRAKL